MSRKLREHLAAARQQGYPYLAVKIYARFTEYKYIDFPEEHKKEGYTVYDAKTGEEV